MSSRKGYFWSPTVTTCLFLQQLATTTRWSDMETTYVIFSLQMSEVLWEVAEAFFEEDDYVLELREGLFRDRTMLYAEKIREREAPFLNCV